MHTLLCLLGGEGDAYTNTMLQRCACNPPDWRQEPAIVRSLHYLFKTGQHDDLRNQLSRAELHQEIPEFHALNLHAMLAIFDGSDLATDYLEMAEATAGSPYELALVSESLAIFDLSNGDALSAARRCLNTLYQIQQTEGLWSRLLLALYRLGNVDAVDVTLEGFNKLDDESNGRLVDLLSIEPDLNEIRQRPAFQQLVARRGDIQSTVPVVIRNRSGGRASA